MKDVLILFVINYLRQRTVCITERLGPGIEPMAAIEEGCKSSVLLLHDRIPVRWTSIRALWDSGGR